MGGPSAPGLSLVGAHNWMHNSENPMFEACRTVCFSSCSYSKFGDSHLDLQYHGSAFRIALPDRWLVIVSGTKLIEQLVRRPESELSSMEGNVTVCIM